VTQVFPRGDSNVQVNYFSACCFVGDNTSMDNIFKYGYYDIMNKSELTIESVDYVDFYIPFCVGDYNWKMTRSDGVIYEWNDDTSKWTKIDDKKYRIKKTDFSNLSLYRLIYIPKEIEMATTLLSSCNMLQSIGGRDDDKGGGGLISTSVGGFSESYGDAGKYGAQIKQWRDMAIRMVSGLKSVKFKGGRF